MDLQYLLALQQLRSTAGSLLTPLMLFISSFASAGSLIICLIIYWGIDREFGYWVIANCMSGLLINHVIKLTACVYRPWIRWPSITPPEEALKSATGYSFPSSHTQIASSMYSSCAVRTSKDHRMTAVFCFLMILLAGFSRNYLGVHTPQDVAVSIVLGVLITATGLTVSRKIRQEPDTLNRLIAGGCIFCILCALYFHFKSYPMEYEEGVLIVDPIVMVDDGFAVAGSMFGFLAGAFLEIRYIRFTTEGTVMRRCIRVLGGVPLAAALYYGGKGYFYSILGKPVGHFVLFMLIAFYAIAVYPALFSQLRKRMDPS